jgi:hypothetical protein
MYRAKKAIGGSHEAMAVGSVKAKNIFSGDDFKTLCKET